MLFLEGCISYESCSPNGLILMLLTFETPLSSQLQVVDAVLHKATDEILSIEFGSNSKSSNRITYTSRMQELQRKVVVSGSCSWVVLYRFRQISRGGSLEFQEELSLLGAEPEPKMSFLLFSLPGRFSRQFCPLVCLLCAERAICLLAEDGYGAGLDLFI
ncbi:hypothetical protein Patl1_26992 [Pistacia atlantica]|uniref:Uncharacterized protein n=1 Tax=Pistacia atlantica TaxID=434234 RepID=A0ACC1B1Y2_9ROSI|nr:hypothetical protein Patl1_26992 [Pistacia atlantica]